MVDTKNVIPEQRMEDEGLDSVDTTTSTDKQKMEDEGLDPVDTTTSTQNKRDSSLTYRICKVFVVPIVILAIAGFLLGYFLGGNDIIPNMNLFNKEDPHMGQPHAWSFANGQGLNLTIINALDLEWYPFFDLAVSQWDNGTPDSLTLSTQIIDPDYSCSSVDGVLKMCNGDYGNTDWKGINKILLKDGKIVSSSGRMNENYFRQTKGDNADDKQYTMCHEVRNNRQNDLPALLLRLRLSNPTSLLYDCRWGTGSACPTPTRSWGIVIWATVRIRASGCGPSFVSRTRRFLLYLCSDPSHLNLLVFHSYRHGLH
jgi:hypothetical protein